MPKMRLGWYAGVSTALAGSVVLSAFYQRPNFYSAMVYLSQSNFCLLALINFTLLLYSSFLYALTRLCFGPLRAVEMEQLTERAWFAITETCLAMTIFREEIGAWFLVMFTALVTGKVWGWIGDGRVEVLEQQPPANPRLFHTRLSVSLAASLLYDIWLLRYTINTVIQQARPNMMVMFLFEFAVLATCSWRTGIRYLLSLAEQHIVKTQTRRRLNERREEVRQQREAMLRERDRANAAGEAPSTELELPSEDDIDEMDIEVPGWASKGEWVLWLDLITDLIKLGIYIAFFFMLLMFYGLPIHIIRDLFVTTRDFLKRLNALLRYRRAIQEMNQYPDATEEELSRENTCIICREEMRPWDPAANPTAVDRIRPKKLPCGHTLHLGCLKSWLERQQVCPTCRRPVSMDRNTNTGGNRRVGVRIQLGGPAGGPAQPIAVNAPGNGPPNAQNPPPQNGPQPQQPQQPQQQQQGEQRPRVFNLGPLRFGFAANGQQVNELARQFGVPGHRGHNNQANGAASTPNAAPPVSTTSADPLDDAANHIRQAEEALRREVLSLQNRQQEVATSQLLLAELQRLRHQRELGPAQGAGPTLTHEIPPAGGSSQVLQLPPVSSMGPPPAAVPASNGSPTLTRYGAPGYENSIPSGSSELPEGVEIPPGWSLMPLQRLDGGPNLEQSAAATGSAPTNSSRGLTEVSFGSADPNTRGRQRITRTSRHSGTITLMDENGEMRPYQLRRRQVNTANSTTADLATENSRTANPHGRTVPVLSPRPIVPTQGGSGQLFGTQAASDALHAAGQAESTPQSSIHNQPGEGSLGSALGPGSEDGDANHDSLTSPATSSANIMAEPPSLTASTGGSSSTTQAATSSSAGAADAWGAGGESPSKKRKARAATVADASSDEDDD